MNSAGPGNSAARGRPALVVVRCWATLIMLMSGLAGSGCRGLELASENRTPIDQNNPAVGQMAMRMYLRSHPPSRQPLQAELLDQVGSRLAAAANRPEYDWRFQLVDDPQPRIIVFPGANVVVTEGMIAACDNEAEFAGALAHELGHLIAGHQMLHSTPGLEEKPPDSRENVTIRDPRDELEADSIALSLLARAGYDPQALLTFWRNAETNPERTAFVAAHGERGMHLPQLQESLTQAQQIYRVNGRTQGLGIQIVRDETGREQGPQALAEQSDLNEFRWTASNHRRAAARIDPRGAAKPAGWNADLLDEGDWLQPIEGEIQQAGYEWSATDR